MKKLLKIITLVALVFGLSASQTMAGVSIFGNTDTHPQGIVVDNSGNVYTANPGADTVTKIDSNGVSTIKFAETDSSLSYSIVMDSAGNFYTTNRSANSITKISPDGTSIKSYATVGNMPTDLIIDSSDNLYVGNLVDATISKVETSDPNAGVVSAFGTTGGHSFAIVLDSSEQNIFALSKDDKKIVKISNNGANVEDFVTNLPEAWSMTIDSSDNLYVPDGNNKTIIKIDSSGNKTDFVSLSYSPQGVLTDNLDNVYVTGIDHVTKIDKNGNIIKQFDYSMQSRDMFAGNDGSLYLSNFFVNNVLKVTFEDEEEENSSSSSSHKSSSIMFTCKDPKASNYDRFGRHKQSKCKYAKKEVTNTVTNPVVNTTTKCNFVYTQILQEKSQGQSVKNLQKTLNKLGYNAGRVDGIFGKRTKKAVINFQTANGLTKDGVVGSKTGMRLSAACRM